MKSPVVRSLYCPLGGVAGLPLMVEVPQHSVCPLGRRAQACSSPAFTAVKVPSGGLVMDLLLPQHSIRPPGRSPQAESRPAEMAVNTPPGGWEAWGE